MPRPRTLAPILLLAASLGAAPAAADTAVTDELGYPIVGNAMKGGSPKLTEEQERARKKLASTSPAAVRADLTPYLPLCDAAGYPVVGNAATKADRMQPSELCKLVREKRAAEKAKS